MSVVPTYRPFLYNVFVWFLEGQAHKEESKSEISWLMWVKVIFTSFHNVQTVLVDKQN